jgi:hypothetical protein
MDKAPETEKLIANANDRKHKRKSRKSHKGRNEHKKSKNFECNAESKATEQPKPTTETAEQEQRRAKEGKPRPEEGKKQFPGTLSLFSARKSFGKWEIKRRALHREVTSTKFIDFAGSVRKSFAFLCSRPFGFLPFCSVQFSSFSVLRLPFFVSHFPHCFFFSDCSNQSQHCFTFVKLYRN